MLQSHYMKLDKRKALLIILAVSLLTHFLFFGHPNETVFDEVHFGKFISGYYTHQYYFDIHPPLGKLIIAGFGKLFDFKPEFSFASIGDKFPDHTYLALRFLPALAGSLLPIVLFFLALELEFTTLGAFMVGILTVMDTALLTQSRFILLDAFLLLFGFTALLLYLRYRRTGNIPALVSAGVFAGCAVSIKWTGLGFLGLIIVLKTIDCIRNFKLKPALWGLLSLWILPFALYFFIFTLHFSLLNKSGTGDAFMSPEFQKTLAGNSHANDPKLKTPTLLEKFVELNAEMYSSNQRLTATHPYSSQWYTWPFMIRPIYYWVDNSERIYLFGNPIIWWTSTAALVALIGFLLSRQIRLDWIAGTLVGGYVLNLLPFIGIHRVMFLYHYLTALVFGIFILVYVIEKTNKNPQKTFAGLLLLATVAFIYFAPLAYGLTLSPAAYENRIWLQSWR